jgi:hypothetical protein
MALAQVPISVAVGDFNGDGKPDLAVANTSGNNVSVLLGKGDGTFQAAVNYGAGTESDSVTVGDFNGDGKPDLAQCCSLNDVSVGQTIVLCRLPALPEGGRPRSAMVCPTKVNSIAAT